MFFSLLHSNLNLSFRYETVASKLGLSLAYSERDTSSVNNNQKRTTQFIKVGREKLETFSGFSVIRSAYFWHTLQIYSR